MQRDLGLKLDIFFKIKLVYGINEAKYPIAYQVIIFHIMPKIHAEASCHKPGASRLRFRPENGMKAVASGRITVFPRDGAYQLYCDSLIPEGVGDLAVAFQQLKEKLWKEGLFDPAHKKPQRTFVIAAVNVVLP